MKQKQLLKNKNTTDVRIDAILILNNKRKQLLFIGALMRPCRFKQRHYELI
jgi:hypothetical protein